MNLFRKLINKIKAGKDLINIKLPTCYSTNTNTNILDIENWMMIDIKDQATKTILENTKLLKKANKDKQLIVTFSKSVPIGINVDISHKFYWNGESLFSMTQDNNQIKRDQILNQILN